MMFCRVLQTDSVPYQKHLNESGLNLIFSFLSQRPAFLSVMPAFQTERSDENTLRRGRLKAESAYCDQRGPVSPVFTLWRGLK